jgi:hypothetical protein
VSFFYDGCHTCGEISASEIIMSDPIDDLTKLQATALARHYQRIREQVTRAWEQRNRRYVFLVCMLAVAALLSFVQAPIVKNLGEGSSVELSALIKKLPNANNLEVLWNILVTLLVYNAAVVFEVLMIVLLVAVFYLTADLYHRSSLLVDLYLYLALLETEIRSALRLGKRQVAFTREGPFYRVTGTRMSLLIGAANKGMLGCLLFLFFATRLLGDLSFDGLPSGIPTHDNFTAWLAWARKSPLLVLDVVTALMTLPLYLGYLWLGPRPEAKMRDAIALEVDKASKWAAGA